MVTVEDRQVLDAALTALAALSVDGVTVPLRGGSAAAPESASLENARVSPHFPPV